MSIRIVFTIRYIYNGSQIKQLICWFTSSLEFFIWLMWFWFISLGCTLVSGQGLCGLTQLHNLDELELTNCPSATREVCLYLRENMTHCLVVDWKTPPNNTCSILLESPGKKPHSLSRDLFKFLQDHMRFSSFVTTCLAVLAFYPNSGNGRTRRPNITILHLRIHIVLLWLKTSTAYFFFNKNSFYDPPTPFSLSSFFMRFLQNILYMYIQISAFCLLPFFDKLNLSYHWK